MNNEPLHTGRTLRPSGSGLPLPRLYNGIARLILAAPSGRRRGGAGSQRGSLSIRVTFLAAWTFLPLLGWLVWMAATFSGLNNAEALDYAQLARHLARGDGFVTSALLPLSLALVPRLEAHPSLSHPPLFPLWEALLFRLGGARPAMAALASGTAWLLTLWFVYALAVRLFDRRVAFFAVALFAVNLTALRFSVSGLPHLLAAALLTAVLWTLAGPRTEEEETAKDFLPLPPGGWLILSAVLTGIAVLSDYSLAWPVVGAVGLYWILLSREWAHSGAAQPARMFSRWTTRLVRFLRGSLPLHVGAVFGIVLLLTVSPWLVRNVRVIGHPCFSLTRYDLLTQTSSYPGESVYRRFTELPQPWEFAAMHPLQTARKTLRGLGRLAPEAGDLANWAVLALFLAGCLCPPDGDAGRVQRTFLLMLLLHAALLSVTSQQFDRLLALVPGMTVWAAGTVYRLLGLLAPSGDTRGAILAMFRGRRQALAVGAVGALAALPLAASRVNPSPAPPIEPSANVAYLAEQTPAGRAIMTNGPWLVAWYGDRPAVWLVQEAGELPLLEKKTGQPLSYLYFSRYRGRLGAEEIADWWLAARQSPLGCETFLPHPSRAAGEVVLKRYGGLQDGALEAGEKWLADYPNHPVALNNLACLYAEKGRNLDRALALARRAVKASPENAATWDTLGWICYRAGRSQEALEPLREAVRRRPDRGLYYYHLGKALLARGHRREAAQSLRTGLSRGLPPAEKKDAESSLRAGASGP